MSELTEQELAGLTDPPQGGAEELAMETWRFILSTTNTATRVPLSQLEGYALVTDCGIEAIFTQELSAMAEETGRVQKVWTLPTARDMTNGDLEWNAENSPNPDVVLAWLTDQRDKWLHQTGRLKNMMEEE